VDEKELEVEGIGQGNAAGSWLKSEIRDQTSGVKLISDLRLLTSVTDDFYDFNELTNNYWLLYSGLTHFP